MHTRLSGSRRALVHVGQRDGRLLLELHRLISLVVLNVVLRRVHSGVGVASSHDLRSKRMLLRFLGGRRRLLLLHGAHWWPGAPFILSLGSWIGGAKPSRGSTWSRGTWDR
jgi:hypothetical protein